MKYYSSFLIRCWFIEDTTQDEKRIIDVEHIQTGVHMRVVSLTDAQEWMFEAWRNVYSEANALPESENDRPQKPDLPLAEPRMS